MNKVTTLYDASKTYSGLNAQVPDQFIALAGDLDLGSRTCGVKMHTERIQTRYENKTTIYGQVWENMVLDATHAGFCHMDSSQMTEYKTLAQTLTAYNEAVKKQFPDNEEHLLKNIPSQSPEFREESYYEGYNSLQSCTILNYAKKSMDETEKSSEDERYVALALNQSGRYTVLDDLQLDPRFHTFNLNRKKDINFKIEDLQEALDTYEQVLHPQEQAKDTSFLTQLKSNVNDLSDTSSLLQQDTTSKQLDQPEDPSI